MTVSTRKLKPAVSLIGSALLLAGGLASADTAGASGFSATELSGGYLLADKGEVEGKCGGEAKGEAEGKCGEGKCGGEADAKDAAEGKCGEGKCGGETKEG